MVVVGANGRDNRLVVDIENIGMRGSGRGELNCVGIRRS